MVTGTHVCYSRVDSGHDLQIRNFPSPRYFEKILSFDVHHKRALTITVGLYVFKIVLSS
jgi:hypothetical protein